MENFKITIKDLKTWMTSDSYAMCKEISVTIGNQTSYVQGSKHINPAVYYAAERIQELEKLITRSIALNEELVQLCKAIEGFVK